MCETSTIMYKQLVIIFFDIDFNYKQKKKLSFDF